MSSDYTNSKVAIASAYPLEAMDAASFGRVEPLPTPQQIRDRYFRGLTMVSPLTGQPTTDDQLKDDVIRAVNMVELDLKITISPVRHKKRLPYQQDDYNNFIYMVLPDRPILSIDNLSIVTADQQIIYQIPPNWIDTANFNYGRVNVIPLSTSYQASGAALVMSTGGGSGGFLLFQGGRSHIPAYWQVEYTSGFRMEQGVPVNINELIGMKAAMMALRNLIPQNQFSSHSLGLDGVSQSQSNQAAQLYAQVYALLEKQYDDVKAGFVSAYSTTIVVDSLS